MDDEFHKPLEQPESSISVIAPNLLIFDKSGKVIAVSNRDSEHLVGKILTQEWVEKTLNLKDTSKYCVSKFEKTSLYDNQ